MLKSSSITSLQTIANKLKKDCPEEEQIDTTVNNLVSDWNEVLRRLNTITSAYSKAETRWTRVTSLKNDIEDWVRSIYPQVELGKPSPAILVKLKEELPGYELKMNELQALAAELCVSLCPQQDVEGLDSGRQPQQLPLNLELEVLSRKLLFLKTYLTSVHTVLEESPAKTQLLEEAKVTLSSASKVLFFMILICFMV